MRFKKFFYYTFALLFFISLSTNSASAATFSFNKLYKGSGTSYDLNTQSILGINEISGTSIQFYQAGSQFSGNSINGVLTYYDNNSQLITIYGTLNRKDKTGNKTNSFYFLASTDATYTSYPGDAYLFVVPGSENLYSNTNNVSTSSDNVDASLNNEVANLNSIKLSSSSGTDSQSICVNTSITSITYTTTIATGANFSGLPAGVTGGWSSNIVTISGTPTVAGTYTFTITLTGGTGSGSATGNIVVKNINTITLSSSAGTNSQTINDYSPIANITYNTTNATGASITGLPNGISGSWSSNIFTISGTSSASITTTTSYNYIITNTGGCGVFTETGSILVNPTVLNTIVLSSNNGSDNQQICINSSIASITYTTTTATGANFSGLPTGVTGVWSSDIVTINGTPTVSGTYTYTVTLTGGNGNVQKTGNITVSPTTVGGTIAGSAAVCSGTNSTTLTLSGNTGTVSKWQSSTSANFGSPIDITNTTTSLTASNLTATNYYRAVVQSGSCSAANSGTATITVSPTSVGGIIAGSAEICSGTNSTTLTLSGNTGTVIKWQSSTSANFASPIDITNTTTSLTASNLTTTTYYRAVVQSGSCTAANSGTATITVSPLSVGGTIAGSASVCSGSNSTVLTLSGNTGNVTKWQSAGKADFSGTITDIANTTSSFTVTNLSTSTFYRAIVQSGSCTAANSGTASITVTDCTQANPDNNTTSVNIPVSGNVSTNDIIAAGTNYGTPTAFITNPTGATITMDATSGTYTFTATKPGKYEFYVPVCGAGQTSNCQLTLLQITVLDPTIPNNLPVANADIATTSLNTAVTTYVLTNDKSGNIGTVLVPSSVSVVTQPVNGTAVANADGTITYTPTTGFSANDSLVYNVCDNASPANCQSTFVYYKVLASGASSVTSAIDDYAFVNNNKTGTASVSGNVLSNDKNTAGSALTATLVTGPTAAQGTLTFNADGSFTFVPALGFNGPIDVVYNACTGDSPAICAKATLHIVVNPPPTINPDFNSTNINVPVPGSINTNDIIPAGTTYGTPIASGNNPSGATISINVATGTYTFTASKPGKYIFNVPVCAASQTTGCPISPLQITVLDPNITTNPPVANNDYSVTQLNTPVVTTILANDKPGNANTLLIPTSIVINTAPKNGTAVANKANSSSSSKSTIKSFSTNGTITYTPNPGFVGLDSLIYTVCDNANPANCEVATVYYTISTATPNNEIVANDDYNTSINRSTATGNVLLNDDYGGAVLTASVVTGPTTAQGTFILSSDGAYSFTPSIGFTGPVDIIYQACSGTTCINATLHILVNLVPPPPPTVINATYVAGSKSNPINIKSLVTVAPTGTTLKWCDPTGVNCSSTPPTIPNLPGTYVWCVKSVDTVTQLSSTCAMDTVIILAPYTVMEVTKTARAVQTNPDGSVLLTFVLKAANRTNALMDSVSIKDDLTQTFNTSSGFSVASLDVYGGLIKNSAYDGVSSVDLVTNQSKIAANSMDSAILKVLVASPNIFGSLTNTAILGGKTKYGYVSVNSNDPIANASDTTKRVPTAFNVPKADLIIAGGFSPNYDGLNDKWIIVRPFGTRVSVQVFNRWGNIVYQNTDYKNDWNGMGTSNFMGQDVPDGTYFYIVNAIDQTGAIKKFTSSLTIVR
ncbi:MAG: hypothetical protein RL387_1058 [Bacteroidota bacterium]|jgi:gliding motility-associated-like protein